MKQFARTFYRMILAEQGTVLVEYALVTALVSAPVFYTSIMLSISVWNMYISASTGMQLESQTFYGTLP